MDRLQMLRDLLAQEPNDLFARYALGMEYSARGEVDNALAEFRILLEASPDYVPAYFMAAQTLVRAQRTDEAKKMLRDGIACAQKKGDRHAQSEMQAMLDELG